MINIDYSINEHFFFHPGNAAGEGFLENNDHLVLLFDPSESVEKIADVYLPTNDLYYISFETEVERPLEFTFSYHRMGSHVMYFDDITAHMDIKEQDSPLALKLMHLENGNESLVQKVDLNFADNNKQFIVKKEERGFEIEFKS